MKYFLALIKMCFNEKISITMFFLGIISILILVIYGSKKYRKENIAISFASLFSIFMQLIEYMMWRDLECNSGLNKIASIIGPILNYMQPLSIFFIYLYLKKEWNPMVIMANILYLFYIIYQLNYYYTTETMCTSINNKNKLHWKWWKTSSIPYHFMTILNIVNALPKELVFPYIIISYTFLILSSKFYSNNTGEMWCFFSIAFPVILTFYENYVL